MMILGRLTIFYSFFFLYVYGHAKCQVPYALRRSKGSVMELVLSPPHSVAPGVEFGLPGLPGATPWCAVSNELGSSWHQAGFFFFCMTSLTLKIVRCLLYLSLSFGL